MWDPFKKKNVVRSTKEKSRLEAMNTAIEFADDYHTNLNTNRAATKGQSFENYAKHLDATLKANGEETRKYKDCHQLLFRPTADIGARRSERQVQAQTARCCAAQILTRSAESGYWPLDDGLKVPGKPTVARVNIK